MQPNLFSRSNAQPQDCILISIPFIPPDVNLEDIDKRGMLLPQTEIKRLQQLSLQDTFNFKKDINCTYDILAKDEELFAAYWGSKHGIPVHEGYFARVKYAQNLSTGEWIARKLIRISDLSLDEDVLNEANLLKHTNMSIITKKSSQDIHFFRFSKSKNHKVGEMLMQYVSGIDLLDFLIHKKMFSEFVKWQLAINLVGKLKELHLKNIAHRDLHQKNIRYIPHKQSFTIIDLGNACMDGNHYFSQDVRSIISHIIALLDDDSFKSLLLEKYIILKAVINRDDTQEESLNILNNLLYFLIEEKNKIPDNERILSVGVLDIEYNTDLHIDKLKRYPIVILKNYRNKCTPSDFAKTKHDLEEQGVFVLDRAISHTDANESQYFNLLYDLMHQYNSECNIYFYDIATNKKLTQCGPLPSVKWERPADAVQYSVQWIR